MPKQQHLGAQITKCARLLPEPRADAGLPESWFAHSRAKRTVPTGASPSLHAFSSSHARNANAQPIGDVFGHIEMGVDGVALITPCWSAADLAGFQSWTFRAITMVPETESSKATNYPQKRGLAGIPKAREAKKLALLDRGIEWYRSARRRCRRFFCRHLFKSQSIGALVNVLSVSLGVYAQSSAPNRTVAPSWAKPPFSFRPAPEDFGCSQQGQAMQANRMERPAPALRQLGAKRS